MPNNHLQVTLVEQHVLAEHIYWIRCPMSSYRIVLLKKNVGVRVMYIYVYRMLSTAIDNHEFLADVILVVDDSFSSLSIEPYTGVIHVCIQLLSLRAFEDNYRTALIKSITSFQTKYAMNCSSI